MSVDYYARMERGDLTGVSPEVLEGLAHALQLDEAETAHLNAEPGGPTEERVKLLGSLAATAERTIPDHDRSVESEL